MMPPVHECESEIDHYTRHYVPYSLRRVCGFFNVPLTTYNKGSTIAFTTQKGLFLN